MTARLEFYVPGRPVPQGSTSAFQRGDKIVTTNDPTGKIGRWRDDVREAARIAMRPSWDVLTGPVLLGAVFHIRRPLTHYLPANSRRSEPVLRDDAPIYHTGTPDLDKLVRAILDALTRVVYVDDKLVARFGPETVKLWAKSPGVLVTVSGIVE